MSQKQSNAEKKRTTSGFRDRTWTSTKQLRSHFIINLLNLYVECNGSSNCDIRNALKGEKKETYK